MVPGCPDKALTSRFAHLPPVVPNNEIGVCRPLVCPPNEGSVPLQIPGQSRLSVSTPSMSAKPLKADVRELAGKVSEVCQKLTCRLAHLRHDLRALACRAVP